MIRSTLNVTLGKTISWCQQYKKLNKALTQNSFENFPIQVHVRSTTALFISTITLAVKHAQLKNEIASLSPVNPTTVTPSVTPPPDMEKYRLPTSIVPKKYDLYLYPDLETGLFKGKVIAHVLVKESTNKIVMHSKDLNITGVSIGSDIEGEPTLDPEYELLNIVASDGRTFSEGSNLTVSIQFEGDMRKRIVGLYLSSYLSSTKGKRNIATSKFEPTFARQAFPCFDEPNLKATYEVHLLKPRDDSYIALSNYPVKDETVEGSGVVVNFYETVPMSTYLSCFIVSDFTFTKDTIKNKDTTFAYRVYATPDQISKTELAKDVGKRVMEFYITYFNIKYPLPKLDMVAIPDFVSGAMEHWGLVTFRETALLYSPTQHSSANKQRVAEVIAHELAHSWFGNYVTMDWWNNLWLNEGFASYIEYKGVDHVFEDWQMMDQFLIDTMHGILALDAKVSSHPIIQKVDTPSQITEVFDSVSYNKGASVLRMLEYAIGAIHFQTGVTNYLNQFKLGNTVSKDLWAELQKVAKHEININDFMDTFTTQTGYPILTANIDNGQCVFKQKLFLADPSSADKAAPSPFNYKWTIPISYITDLGESNKIFWFNHRNPHMTVPLPKYKWIKFNPKQVGYFRINYDELTWENLIMNIEELSIADRAHLLEESFSIAESGELPYETPFTLTKYLKNFELDYIPWRVASGNLQRILAFFSSSAVESTFKNYIQSLLEHAYLNYGWDDSNLSETHLNKRARVEILKLACAVDYPPALKEANLRFQTWISEVNTEIEPNLRDIVYKYGMVNANEELWNKLLERYTNETDANEKMKLMAGLANIRIPSLLSRLLSLAKDDTYIRGQDYFSLIAYISWNPIGTPIVWNYVREHWEELVDRFGLGERNLGRIIPTITQTFTSQVQLEEMQHFFAKYPDAGAGTAARLQALETVENNMVWLKKFKVEVEHWMENKSKLGKFE